MEEKIEDMDFEDALNKLEEINNKLERNKVPLEEAIRLYELGMELVKYCGDKLDEAEGEIKKISLEGEEEMIDEFESDR